MPKKHRTIRWVIAAVIMIATVVLLIHYSQFSIHYVFSGKFLESRFRLPSQLAGDSYQVGINRMLVCAIFLLAIATPIVVAVRWLIVPSNAFGIWLFILFSSAASLFPLCFLIIAFHMILQYIWAMGVTLQRLLGMAVTVLLLTFLIATWLWAIGLLKRKPRDQQDKEIIL